MNSNDSIIIDKGERHDYCVGDIFRAILSGKNSAFNCFIERTKDDWYTRKYFIAVDLIKNATKKYNNTVAAK